MTDIVHMNPEERAYQAYNLRVAGHSWTQIALKLGYDNPGVARRSVNNLISAARESASDEHKKEVLDLELERIDQLQAAYWDAAIGGDVRAFDAVLKAMVHRAKLEQLGEETIVGNRTVIITSEDYEKKLKELADE